MSVHIEGCLCFEGSCCPWMGNCTCQCTCDTLRRVESRSYKQGYSDAIDKITGDIVDKAYKLGYTDALASATKAIAEINTDGLDCD